MQRLSPKKAIYNGIFYGHRNLGARLFFIYKSLTFKFGLDIIRAKLVKKE